MKQTPATSQRETLLNRGGSGMEKRGLQVVALLVVLALPFTSAQAGSGSILDRFLPTAEELGGKPLEITFVEHAFGMNMAFIWIPGGCFQMGSATGDSDEGPVHMVCLIGFWMGRYEVTQAQYQAVMGTNPSEFKGKDLPVENVSWQDAQKFIKRLNDKVKGAPYRLPSEAQWEYACRAGSDSPYFFGSDKKELHKYAWYQANSGSVTHPVGGKRPNDFGLYDMHGNVSEWCNDRYDEKYYSKSSRVMPTGPSSKKFQRRVVRGGNCFDGAWICRPANRAANSPKSSSHTLGFRVLRIP